MKRLAFILLFIILSGLVIVPARAETSYYAVSFTGSGQVSTGTTMSFTDGATIIILFKTTSTGRQALVDARTDTYVNGGTGFNLFIEDGKVLAGIGNGTAYVSALSVAAEDVYNTGEILMLTTRFDLSTATIDVFKNGQLAGYLPNVDVSGPITTGSIVLANSPHGANEYPFSGTIYLVLVYNRLLSDEEIQAIYSDPLNPPTSGLILFYAPDSVDTANNIWKDKSGNGNDGSIVGASYVPLRPVSEALQNEAYAWRFNGSAYLQVSNFPTGNWSGLTIIVIGMYSNENINTDKDRYLIDEFPGFRVHITRTFTSQPVFYVWNGTAIVSEYITQEQFGTGAGMVMQAFVANTETHQQLFYKNSNLSITYTSSRLDNIALENNNVRLMFNVIGEMYLVQIYSRALNSSEIHEIYEHPLDPPKEGLMVYYSPYSYDPESGKWLNLAPILPTIPLSEELDAVNYGAEAVRVSIPDLTVYDAQDGSAIPLENVSVAMVQNNTTSSLLPSLPILPADETVTLNVSANGYNSGALQTPSGVDSVAVYLTPLNLPEFTPPSGLNYTALNVTDYTIDDIIDLFDKWPGGGILRGLFHLNLKEFFTDMFSMNYNVNGKNTSWVGSFLALAIWAGAVFLAWNYFRDPLPVFELGNVMYYGLREFTSVNPGVLKVPFSIFALYMGYLLIKKILAKWSGEI